MTNSGVDMVCHGFFCSGDMIPSLGGAERYAGSLVVAVALDVVVANEGVMDQSASAMRPVLMWSVCAYMLCKKRPRPASPRGLI